MSHFIAISTVGDGGACTSLTVTNPYRRILQRNWYVTTAITTSTESSKKFHVESFYCCYKSHHLLIPFTSFLQNNWKNFKKSTAGWELHRPKKTRWRTKPIRDWHQVGWTAVSLKLRAFQNAWIDELIWILCFAGVLLTLDPMSNVRMFFHWKVWNLFQTKSRKQ